MKVSVLSLKEKDSIPLVILL